jgi:hypothetical protein
MKFKSRTLLIVVILLVVMAMLPTAVGAQGAKSGACRPRIPEHAVH